MFTEYTLVLAYNHFGVPMIAGSKDPAVTIRFPTRAMLKELATAAKNNGRSRNSEIIARLAESLKPNGSMHSEKRT